MTGAAVSLCLFFLMSFCSACYISNCPIGGKRSVMDSPQRKGSRAAASAPVSAVGKGWAAGWAPQRRHAAWRRTTCPPPVRQEGDPVDLKQDAAPHQASVVTQRAAVRTNPVWQKRKATIKSANQRAAMTSSSGSFTWLATPLLIESTNVMPGFHGGHLRDLLLGFVVQSNLVVVHRSIHLFHLPTHLLAFFFSL
ncbi:uncharacterized protein ACWYII_009855 isoform 1-T1 [Salvelinus alpinus]